MKKYYFNFCATLLALNLFLACSDKETSPTEIPIATLETVSGIEKAYSVQQDGHLILSPTLNFSEGSKQPVTYEWIIDEVVVSKEETLDYICKELGRHAGTLKVIAQDETAKFVDFTFYVYSGYDRGLLLFTANDTSSTLVYKALDDINIPAVRNAFSENNPTLPLGKTPLALCWTGEGITNPANIEDTGGMEVILTTDQPIRMYAIDPNTLKVKTEFEYDGEEQGFTPNHAFVPFGMQNRLWGAEGGSVYFTGNGKDYLMSPERRFIKGKRRLQLPSNAKVADMTCSLITNPMDMLRVYFDTENQRMVYVGGIRGMVEGKVACPIIPMALLACDGNYAEANTDNRYEPKHALLVGYKNDSNVMIYRFSPASNKAEESLLSEIDATGHILPKAAIGVNPIRPILYYADFSGNIYVLNYESKNFSTTPYVSLGKQYEVKSIIFNPYNPTQMYIAAEDKEAPAKSCAAIFIIDVSNKATGKVIYQETGVGGKIHRMIYKGNGLENQQVRRIN